MQNYKATHLSANEDQEQAYERTEKIKDEVFQWFLQTIDDDDRMRLIDHMKGYMCLHCGTRLTSSFPICFCRVDW